MKPVKTIEELRGELRSIKRGWSQDSMFAAKALLLIAEELNSLIQAATLFTKSKLVEALQQPRKRATRKPSKWNRFVSRGMKDGKSLKQIAEEWKQQRISR
jgi:formylmethanofuran dehydrogenase subunit B